MSFYDRVICNSLFVQAHFQKKYPQKTTAVIYPCVDSNLLEANHKEASELAGEPKVLMSGAYWKNQKELVSIFKLFLKEAPKACLYFIGPSEEGQQVDELRSAIQSQNLGAQAVILAPRGRENYLSLLRQIDIFAYTHLNEAFGIAVLEAALLEKPIVAYGAGGIVEILQDYPKASLIEPGDQSSFAEALSHIYKGKPMADANLNNLKQKFSKEKFKAAHKKIYDEFL